MAKMLSDTISLRGLELFEQLGLSNSMQEASEKVGLSMSAASQQLRNLELAVGHKLVDHTSRPLKLNADGRVYFNHVRSALEQLRLASAELSLGEIGSISALRVGIIDDLDSDVSPRLAAALAKSFNVGQLSLVTSPSIRMIEEVSEQQIDIAIASRPFDLSDHVTELPIVRDPFIMAIPRGHLAKPPSSIDELSDLSYLRYESGQLISRQITTHFSRLKLAPTSWIEVDSNQALFGLIASGAGWATTTPIGYMRAKRYHDAVDIYAFPYPDFSRTISVFYRDEWMQKIAEVIAEQLRRIVQQQIIEPCQTALPWISNQFNILSD